MIAVLSAKQRAQTNTLNFEVSQMIKNFFYVLVAIWVFALLAYSSWKIMESMVI